MSAARDFWSRRKARVAEEAQAEEVALETKAIAEGQAEKSDEEILADLGLPDPDTLKEGDDFSAFMARAVPDRIRSRALRKLWLTNPILANVDGLVDYGEDFTDAACVIENLSTTYQVGKGMQAHVEEMARQAAAENENAAEDETPSDDELVEELDEDLLADAEATDEAPNPDLERFETPDELAQAPRRRMRFQFDDPSQETATA